MTIAESTPLAIARIVELLTPRLPGLLVDVYETRGRAEGVTVRLPSGLTEDGIDILSGAYTDGADDDALMVTSRWTQADDGTIDWTDLQCRTVEEVVEALFELAKVRLRSTIDAYAEVVRELAPIGAKLDSKWPSPPLAADHKGIRLSADGFIGDLVEDLRGLVHPWHVEVECDAVQEGTGWVCTWAVEIGDGHRIEDARVFQRFEDVTDEEVSTKLRRKRRPVSGSEVLPQGTSTWEAAAPGPGTYILQVSWLVDPGGTRDRLDRFTPAAATHLEQLLEHLHEAAQRFYAGDVAVCDELFQLYCLDEGHRRTAGGAS
jgi:hypothetical protein